MSGLCLGIGIQEAKINHSAFGNKKKTLSVVFIDLLSSLQKNLRAASKQAIKVKTDNNNNLLLVSRRGY